MAATAGKRARRADADLKPDLSALPRATLEAMAAAGDEVVECVRVLAKTGDVAESPFNGMATSREKLRGRPERIRKSLKALLESFRRIKQDRLGSIDYIRQSFKVNERIAENSYNEIREVMLDDMIMPEERLKKALDGPYSRTEGEKSLSINEIVDYSILRSLR